MKDVTSRAVTKSNVAIGDRSILSGAKDPAHPDVPVRDIIFENCYNAAKIRVAIFWLVLFGGAIVLPAHSPAEDLQIGGHLKTQGDFRMYSPDSILRDFGADETFDGDFDGRINLEKNFSPFAVVVHGEGLAIGGKTLSALNHLPASSSPMRSPLPDDEDRFARLTAKVFDEENFEAEFRLDRCFLSYAREEIVIEAGRQAITWGNGLVFQVFDVFNPFAPLAIDKDFKTGDDLLNVQWSFSEDSDIQFVSVARRDPETHSLEADASFFGAKARYKADTTELTGLLAQNAHDSTGGMGFSHDLLGAVIRSDLALTSYKEGALKPSIMANVDRTWTIVNTNVYTFLEYFHSGVGSRDPYSSLDPDLVERINRGELYTIGRDYLALGTRIEINPRVNLFPTAIHNLLDQSHHVQLRLNYDIMQDFLVTTGATFPFGPKGSEFGGVHYPLSDKTLRPPVEVFLRVARYF